MTFVVDSRTIGTWHMQLDAECDVLFGLGRDEGGRIVARWRFRYRAGTVDERKNWYGGACDHQDHLRAIEVIRTTLQGLRGGYPGAEPPFEILMDERGVDRFIERLRERMDFKAFIPKEAASTNEEAVEVYRGLMGSPPAGRA